MAHPKKGYYLKDGTRVIGTTTCIGRFKESGGLMWWACEQGKAIERGEISHMYEKRDDAADIGTATHFLVFRHIHGLPNLDLEKVEILDMGDDGTTVLNDDYRQAMQSGFDAYIQWERMTKLEITHQEIQLVSTIYKFGGCPDAVGIIDGLPCLLDWKTSKRVYQDFLIQIAAYGYLCQYGVMPEHNYKRLGIKVHGFHLCKFSKEYGDFAHHYYPELDIGWEQMKLFLKAYQNDKILKKRAG
jgi:hypothetical protein